MAGKFVDIGNANNSSFFSSRSAYAFAHFNRGASRLAAEGTKHELFAIEKVEAAPIYVFERVVEKRCRIRQSRNERLRWIDQRVEFFTYIHFIDNNDKRHILDSIRN